MAPVGVAHPSKKFFALSAAFSFLAFLQALIAIFVPWSWKDTAVFQRTTIGLWMNCDEHTNAPVYAYTCRDNDIDQVGSIAGGSEKCRGFVAATQVFTVAGCVFAFLALVTAALVIGKLWSKPIVLGLYACLMAFFSFSCIMIAFLMWICYVEEDCQPGSPLFPVRSYSWGWILMVVATLWALFAMILAYLGLFFILRYKPFIPAEVKCEAPMYEEIMPVPSPFVCPCPAPAVSFGSPVPMSYPVAGYAPDMMAPAAMAPTMMPYPAF